MRNDLARLKLKQRLNKLASSDYQNLECWQELEVINKAQLQWCRRQLHGSNQFQEGDEESKKRIDDLNILLELKELKSTNKQFYFETEELPSNYLEFKKVVVTAFRKDCNKKKRINCYLVSEADAEIILGDYLRQPSFQWGETICTLFGNKVRIWTNEDFLIDKCELSYYRLPKPLQDLTCINYDGSSPLSEQTIEFKDDIKEIIIDEAASIVAADMGDANNYQRLLQESEKSN